MFRKEFHIAALSGGNSRVSEETLLMRKLCFLIFLKALAAGDRSISLGCFDFSAGVLIQQKKLVPGQNTSILRTVFLETNSESLHS